MKNLNYIGITLIALLGNCAQPSHSDQRESINSFAPTAVTGEINEDMVDRINSILHSDSTVILSSPGGDVVSAINLAESARRKSLDVIVVSICNSACSGIALLGFENILFHDAPLVGFHGNMYMKNYLYNKASGRQTHCFLEEEKRFRELIETSELKHEFWLEQMHRLGPYNLEYDSRYGECGLLYYELQVEYWFPNTAQLKELMGLRFSGSVAADEPDAAMEKVREYFGSGVTVMVGGEIFVT